MNDQTNIILVQAAQAGDQIAFESLVDQYYSMVHGLTYSKVGEWAVAQDLTQDVFLTAWTSLHTLRHPEAFLVWLRRIARNSALNWLRTREYRRRLAEQNDRGSVAPKTEEDPSGEVARRECLEQVGEAVQSLSLKLREAVVLYYLEGQTAADAADALGISVDAMKKRLRLGRKKLQEYYARQQVDNLEQLLPHRPKRQVQNIVAGLAIGPAMPELNAASTGSGMGMWLNDLWHGASPQSVFSGAWQSATASLAGLKTGAAAAVLLTVGGAGAVAILVQSGSLFSSNAEAGAALQEPIIASSTAAQSDETQFGGPSILVTRLHAGATTADEALQPGDRIVRVGGRLITASGNADPVTLFGGLRGSTTSVTVIRPAQGSKAERQLTTNIIWPFDPTQMITQNATE